MGKLFSVAICFWAWVGLAGASTDQAGPDQAHYENAWVVVVLFAWVGLNAWMYWHLWKNRLPEEKSKLKIASPALRPVIQGQTPVQRKKLSRERVKVPV